MLTLRSVVPLGIALAKRALISSTFGPSITAATALRAVSFFATARLPATSKPSRLKNVATTTRSTGAVVIGAVVGIGVVVVEPGAVVVEPGAVVDGGFVAVPESPHPMKSRAAVASSAVLCSFGAILVPIVGSRHHRKPS
jgi:hypothetical protein